MEVRVLCSKTQNLPMRGNDLVLLLKYKPNFDEAQLSLITNQDRENIPGMLGGFICKPLINQDSYSSIDEDEDHIFAISGMDDGKVRKSYKQTHPVVTIISFEHSERQTKENHDLEDILRVRTDVGCVIKDIEVLKTNVGDNPQDIRKL